MQHSLRKQPRDAQSKQAEMAAADHALVTLRKGVQKPSINETELNANVCVFWAIVSLREENKLLKKN